MTRGFSVTVNKPQFDAFGKKMKSLENIQRKMKPPMEKAVELVEKDISKYKPKARGAFSRLATPGQKRAFFAKVSRGEAQVDSGGYVRKKKTKKGWRTKVETNSDGIRGIVDNVEPHAIYVHGSNKPGGQQPFHAVTGFTTEEQTIEKNEKRITREFNKVVKRELNK